MYVTAGNFAIDLSRTNVMGVVNLTPDSFSHDGLLTKNLGPRGHLRYIQRLIDAGADILDIGAESTRPGSQRISSKEELERLVPTLKILIPNIKVPVSIDSYKLDVIHAALDMGVTIINNIQGHKINHSLLKLAKNYNAAVVIMHMRGTPQTMQRKVVYENLIEDIKNELGNVVDFCLDFGLKKDKIIIDPGIGFAKTSEQNLIILKQLSKFRVLNVPILIGTSRKSFLGKAMNDMSKNRLAATASSVAISILNGAHIIRVHDVAFMKDVAILADKIKNS